MSCALRIMSQQSSHVIDPGSYHHPRFPWEADFYLEGPGWVGGSVSENAYSREPVRSSCCPQRVSRGPRFDRNIAASFLLFPPGPVRWQPHPRAGGFRMQELSLTGLLSVRSFRMSIYPH